ncbi:MAG: hypothetical protein AAFW98_20570, partial [Pseudomonadota bacterium]
MSTDSALGPSPQRTQGPRWGVLARRHGGLVAFAILILLNIAITPNFLQLQTLFVNISQVATIAIVAVGMTLVIATKGIDLSVGAVMALSGALSPLIFGSPFGVAYPTMLGLFSGSVGEADQGWVMGITTAVFTLAGGVMSLIGGVLMSLD